MQTILPYITDDKSLFNKSTCHKTSVHIAFILKRGQIIAKATNSIGSRSRGCGYSDYTIHAERAVVKELGDISKLRGATMYVVRISRDRQLSGKDCIQGSEPCYDCCRFLKKCRDHYGLSKVFYSTHDLVELDLSELPEKKKIPY